MKRVEDRGGVGEFVVDGVLVAAERVQGGDLDVGLERRAALVEPGLGHGPGTARDEVEEPSPDASALVTGQMDHAGEFSGPALAGVDVVPQVLVHAQGRDAGEPGLVSGGPLQDRRDTGPHGPPRRGQLAGQPGDRGMLATYLFHDPAARPGGEQGPRLGDPVVLLGEHPHRTRRLRTRPRPLAPQHHRRRPEKRCVDEPDRPPAMRTGDHPAHRTTHDSRRRLDRDLQLSRAADHAHDMETGKAHQQVATVAIGIKNMAARRAARRLGHSRGPQIGECGNS
jgi:hypothetical protein